MIEGNWGTGSGEMREIMPCMREIHQRDHVLNTMQTVATKIPGGAMTAKAIFAGLSNLEERI